MPSCGYFDYETAKKRTGFTDNWVLVERKHMTTSTPETFIYRNDRGEEKVVTISYGPKRRICNEPTGD